MKTKNSTQKKTAEREQITLHEVFPWNSSDHVFQPCYFELATTKS
jgi:hypothetical protein